MKRPIYHALVSKYEVSVASKSAIDKAGRKLSDLIYCDGEMPTADLIEQYVDTVETFRSAHAYPMMRVRYGLRSMIQTCGSEPIITQRLKRVPRILLKLHRMRPTRLSTLEDIGGVRALFRTPEELDRVHERILRNKNWVLLREPRNYVDVPKRMGYRALHVAVERGDRAIEVQLRAFGQQQWAEAVESADARLGFQLKDEDGPAEMIEYFKLAAEVIHAQEYGPAVAADMFEEFERARQAVIAAGHYRQ